MSIANNSVQARFNMIEILKRSLESEVKKVLTESLVSDQLARYEEELRGKLKPMVDEISFSVIKGIKDYAMMRDEVHVFLKWDDEQKTHVSRRIK